MDAAHLTPLLSHCLPQMEFHSLWKTSVTMHAKQEPLVSWLRAIRDSMGGRPCPSCYRGEVGRGFLSMAPLRGVHEDPTFHKQPSYI